MDEKQLKALYDAMQNKLGLGTFDQFKSSIQSDSNFRKAFHGEASKELEIGDYATFETGLKKKPTSKIGSQAASALLSQSPSLSQGEKRVESGELAGVRYLENTPEREKLLQLGKDKIYAAPEFDVDDPIGSSNKIVLSKLPQIKVPNRNVASSTATKKPITIDKKEDVVDVAKEPEGEMSFQEGYKTMEGVKNAFAKNTGESLAHLMKRTGVMDSEALYDDGADERIKASLKPGNETDAVAYQRLQEAKNARKSIQGASSFEEAAVNFEAMQNPELAAQIDKLRESDMYKAQTFQDMAAGVPAEMIKKPTEVALGEATRGRLIFDAVNNSAFAEEVLRNPTLRQQYQTILPQLKEKYPEFGKMLLGNVISQKMEDMGMNNALLNVVTKEETDKVVDELIKTGQMSLADKKFYEDNIRGTGLGNMIRTLRGKGNFRTPGLLENTGESFTQGATNLAKGVYEFTGARNLVVGKDEQLRQDIEKSNQQVNIKTKNIINEIAQSGGQIAGQSFSIGGTSGLLTALKVMKNPMTAMSLAGATQAYANYIPQARMKFPGDELKQRAWATINSYIEYRTEKIFNDQKVVDGLMRKIKPKVAETINDFTNKKISAIAAREQIQTLLGITIKDIPEATKYFGKAVAQNTVEELGAKLGQDGTDGVFEGKPFSEWVDGEELWQTARQAFLGSTVIGGLASRADMKKNKGITAKSIYDMAQDPDYWREQMTEAANLDPQLEQELPDKLENLEVAANVLKDLEGTEMNEKQKVKYLITELEKRVRQKQAASLTTQPLIAKEQKEIQNADKIQNDLLEGKDDGSIEGDRSDEEIKGHMAFEEEQTPSSQASDVKVESAVIEIGGKMYEGKNHAEAILKAKADGQDISKVNRQAEGKFKLSDGTIIDRSEAKKRFGQDRSELMIEQDDAADNANKEYRKITEPTPISESNVEGVDEKVKLKSVKIGEFEKDEMLSMIDNRKDTVEGDPESSFGIESEEGALDNLKQKIELGDNNFTQGELEWLKSEVDDLLEKTQAAIEADGNPEAKKRLPKIKKLVNDINQSLSSTTQQPKANETSPIQSQEYSFEGMKKLKGEKHEGLNKEEAINRILTDLLGTVGASRRHSTIDSQIGKLEQWLMRPDNDTRYVKQEVIDSYENEIKELKKLQEQGFETFEQYAESKLSSQENTNEKAKSQSVKGVEQVTPSKEAATTEQIKEPPSPPTEGEGAVAGEEDSGLSGIKKALVSDEIIKGVDLERVPDKEMMALGRKILDTGEVNPEALVTKIITEGKGVLTPTEVVALITYKRDIDNKIQDTYKEINKRKEAGEDLGTLGVEAVDLERQQHDFDVMAVITAQQQSMAFRLRQRMLDRDYNVVTQIEKYKKNNNGYIPEEVEAKFKELGKQLDEVKVKLAEAEKKAAEKGEQESVDNIKESVGRETKLTEEELDKKVQEGVEKEISKLYEQLSPEKKTLADKAIAALEKFRTKLKGGGRSYDATLGIPIYLIDKGAAVAIRAIKVGRTVAQAVKIGIKTIKDGLKEKNIDVKDWEDKIEKDLTDFLEGEGVSTKPVKDKPTINEDGTVSIPNQMIRDLVSKGVTDINDLADAVHKEVVKDLPNITKRQVRDYITDYGRTVNPTADEIQQQVNTAKRVGRLLSELEDLQNKKAKAKNPETKNKITEKERGIKRKIRALEKDLGVSNKRILSDDEKLTAAKQRVKDRISELERKIKNKDFAKPVKKLPVTDKELVELNKQKEKLEEEFDTEQFKLELKNRTWWKKAEDIGVELASGVVRGLVASVDLSAGGVQGMYRIFTDFGKSIAQLVTLRKVTRNRSATAFKEMFKSFVSKKYSEDYMAKLKSSPIYPRLQAVKLAIDDKSGHVSAKEGLWISNWVNLIYDKVVAPALSLPISVFTKGNVRKGYDIAKAINPYLASQRAFDGYVNSIRVSSYIDMDKSLEKDGYNFEADSEQFKKAADFVNTTTGRGTLGSADPASKWLNIVFFAPRKVISEVKMFSPYAFFYYAKMPAPVRKMALKNLGTFLLSFTTVNSLIWASSKPDEDDDEAMKIWWDFWNPNSSNFLTHVIGGKRVSIGGGAKSMINFLSRLWSGKYVDQYGNETELGDRFGKQINTRFDLITNFVAGKTSPAFNVAIQKFQERKGLELDNADVVKDLTVPIWMQDLKNMYKDDPASVNAILTVLSIFGANVRTTDASRSPFTDEDKKDPTFKYFLDKGMNLPNVVPASINVPDKATKTVKNLTDYPEEKIKEYQTEHKKFLKSELKEVKDKGYVYEDDYENISTDYKKPPKGYHKEQIDNLTKEQLAKILKSAQSTATDKTKNKLFPK